MADIRPFKGVFYNPAKIPQMADVIAPPYDVISAEQKKEFLGRSPYNIVRLTLPDGEDPYVKARQLFHEWLAEETLTRDGDPSLYIYDQTFVDPDGREKTRKGFLSLLRVEDFDKGSVLPHEATLFAPKEDRLNLLRACKANFEPIFGLYSDQEHRLDSLLDSFREAPPRFKITDETGMVHSVWPLTDASVLDQVSSFFRNSWVLIADGHHRYESCIVYRNERSQEDSNPEAPFHFTLIYLSNIHHPGLTVLPYNRAVHGLPKFDGAAVLKKSSRFFETREFVEQEQAMLALKKEGKSGVAFVALLQGLKSIYLFKTKPHLKIEEFFPAGTPQSIQWLDVNVLHKVFIENILSVSEKDIQEQKFVRYYKDPKEEMRDFESGRVQIAFFLNPTRVEQVVEVSRSGEKMPQKSTFFYPKVMTGFVINRHE